MPPANTLAAVLENVTRVLNNSGRGAESLPWIAMAEAHRVDLAPEPYLNMTWGALLSRTTDVMARATAHIERLKGRLKRGDSFAFFLSRSKLYRSPFLPGARRPRSRTPIGAESEVSSKKYSSCESIAIIIV